LDVMQVSYYSYRITLKNGKSELISGDLVDQYIDGDPQDRYDAKQDIIKGIKPQGKPWTRIKRNDPGASGRGIKKHNKQYALFLLTPCCILPTLFLLCGFK